MCVCVCGQEDFCIVAGTEEVLEARFTCISFKVLVFAMRAANKPSTHRLATSLGIFLRELLAVVQPSSQTRLRNIASSLAIIANGRTA